MAKAMKRLFLALGIGGLVVVALFLVREHLRNPGTISEITLEQKPGWLGPMYQVTFRPHQAIFVGFSNTGVIGTHASNEADFMKMIGTYESSDADFESLAKAIQHSSFLLMGDDYFVYASDMTSVITSIDCTHGRKTVQDYGDAAPRELTGLEDQINQTISRAHWHKVSDSRQYPITLVVPAHT